MRQISTDLDLSIRRSGAQWLVTPLTSRGRNWITDNIVLPVGVSHDDGFVLNKLAMGLVVETANDAGLVVRLGW
jgi:hypothetical protein